MLHDSNTLKMVMKFCLEDSGGDDLFFAMQTFLSLILSPVKYCFKCELIYSFCISPILLLKRNW